MNPSTHATSWPEVGALLIPVLGVFIIQLFQYLSQRLQNEHLARVERKVDDTHTLVNSGNQVQLELIVAMATELVEKDPTNLLALQRLTAAQKALADHKMKQAVVDDRTFRNVRN
jgi:hypothetical protein